MGRILGIDLGTTNSCVAVLDRSTPQVLSNRSGSRTTPSVVAFTDDGGRLVGHVAKRQAITNPQNTIFAVKRLIGRKFDSREVQRAVSVHLPYLLVEAENGDVHVDVRGRHYSPQEVSSILLRELRAMAEESLGESVEDAIVTVPAYFDDTQRQATKDAGQIAGLNVLRIINEPTAAALAYGLDEAKKERNIAVFDLGGGTFDISIMHIENGLFEVKATSGNPDLGGEDFDRRIMQWLIEDFEGEHGVDLRQDRMALQRLKEAAERAKAELSTNDTAEINLPFIATAGEGPLHLAKHLSAKQFEGLVEDLVQRTVDPCLDALHEADLKPEDIDEVLLVGGQTRSPIVARTVTKIFGRRPNAEINPDEVVAMGAAIQGGIIDGGIKDVVLLDVTPLSLGIETRGHLFTKLIPRNSTIPTKASQIFTTVIDNQDTVEIHVVQGEREIATENRSLGKIELVGIPPSPKGVPQIEVTFAIDSNSIHTVSARDLATSMSQSLQINPASGLTADEMDRIVEEAQAYADSDRKKKEHRVLRNRLEGLVETNSRVFDQFRDSLQEPDQERARVTLRAAQDTLHSDNETEMEAMMFELQSLSKTLSAAMLKSTSDDKE